MPSEPPSQCPQPPGRPFVDACRHKSRFLPVDLRDEKSDLAGMLVLAHSYFAPLRPHDGQAATDRDHREQ